MISGIVVGIAITALLLWMLFSVLRWIYRRLFQHNCYRCKHYSIGDVASVGDWHWMRCAKNRNIRDGHRFRDCEHWRTCKEFERK